jgi:cytochrome P450
MMDNATPEEKELHEMANLKLILTLASINTTSTNASAFLYELCAHPEWFPVLREEIEQVNQKTQASDKKQLDIRRWHPQLEKMDSFLLECFRIRPLILLIPQRVALQSYTLKDGTHIPKGCRIGFANGAHQNHPNTTPNPETFDPMRSYNKRQTSEEEYNRHQASLTDINDNLGFGYGNQACPGRFLGVAEIKMLLARLISEFDFKYPEGKSLPRTLTADENLFLEPGAKLMMRRRSVGDLGVSGK